MDSALPLPLLPSQDGGGWSPSARWVVLPAWLLALSEGAIWGERQGLCLTIERVLMQGAPAGLAPPLPCLRSRGLSSRSGGWGAISHSTHLPPRGRGRRGTPGFRIKGFIR